MPVEQVTRRAILLAFPGPASMTRFCHFVYFFCCAEAGEEWASEKVCTDTVAKLRRPLYKGMFAILEPGEEAGSYACCGPDGSCC